MSVGIKICHHSDDRELVVFPLLIEKEIDTRFTTVRYRELLLADEVPHHALLIGSGTSHIFVYDSNAQWWHRAVAVLRLSQRAQSFVTCTMFASRKGGNMHLRKRIAFPEEVFWSDGELASR